jgi:hypothetical protein
MKYMSFSPIMEDKIRIECITIYSLTINKLSVKDQTNTIVNRN